VIVLIGAGDETGIQSFTAGAEKELVGNFLTLVGDSAARADKEQPHLYRPLP
jgi:hypothetical protein